MTQTFSVSSKSVNNMLFAVAHAGSGALAIDLNNGAGQIPLPGNSPLSAMSFNQVSPNEATPSTLKFSTDLPRTFRTFSNLGGNCRDRMNPALAYAAMPVFSVEDRGTGPTFGCLLIKPGFYELRTVDRLEPEGVTFGGGLRNPIVRRCHYAHRYAISEQSGSFASGFPTFHEPTADSEVVVLLRNNAVKVETIQTFELHEALGLPRPWLDWSYHPFEGNVAGLSIAINKLAPTGFAGGFPNCYGDSGEWIYKQIPGVQYDPFRPISPQNSPPGTYLEISVIHEYGVTWLRQEAATFVEINWEVALTLGSPFDFNSAIERIDYLSNKLPDPMNNTIAPHECGDVPAEVGLHLFPCGTDDRYFAYTLPIQL